MKNKQDKIASGKVLEKNKKMNAIIVNTSDIVEYRADMVYDYLKENGWGVNVITSDYMHIEKRKRLAKKTDYVMLDTIPYRKNISYKRLYSHYDLARKVEKILDTKDFDLLYLIVPINSLALLGKKYCNNAKIIIDILDLWPESMPIKGTDRFPFTIWAGIRNNNLQYADYIVTECDFYQKKLKKWLYGKKVQTIYWCHKKQETEYIESNQLPSELTLCYLGSINNIIDISMIVELCIKLHKEKTVTVKIIGDGEKKGKLISALEAVSIHVIDYGKIYDIVRKKEIIDTCHFGINIMKPTVSVGLSMKSIDYLQMGLPIINNLKGDLNDIISKYKCGVNMDTDDYIYEIISEYDPTMRSNARKAYESEFSNEIFNHALNKVIAELF